MAALNVIGAATLFGTPDGPLGVIRTRIAPLTLAVWIVGVGVGLLRMAKAPQPMTQPASSWEESAEHRDGALARG